MKMVKKLWCAAALILVASSAMAQEPTCATQIRTANAMMEELQQQVRMMSARAAQHYGRNQALSVELNAAQAEVARLSKEQQEILK